MLADSQDGALSQLDLRPLYCTFAGSFQYVDGALLDEASRFGDAGGQSFIVEQMGKIVPGRALRNIGVEIGQPKLLHVLRRLTLLKDAAELGFRLFGNRGRMRTSSRKRSSGDDAIGTTLIIGPSTAVVRVSMRRVLRNRGK